MVDAKCLVGTGSATTAADGTYTITVAEGALPCVVRATSGSLILHSVASGAGASASRANVTPLTEMVVARLAGDAPATFFTNFAGASLDYAGGRFAATFVVGSLSTSVVAPVAASVIASLEANGLSLSGVGDPLAGPLTATSASAPGDLHDQALDRLANALAASGVTLGELVQAVIRASPHAPADARTILAGLPPERLLATAASNCPSFRSGRYRLIVNEAATAPAQGLVDFDAATLALRDPASATTSSLVATGPCAYQNASGGELAVSRSGVVMGRATGPDLQLHALVAIPEQAHSLDELEGSWNYISMERTTAAGPVHLTAGTSVFDLQGRLTAQDFCDDMKTCAAVPAGLLPAIQITPDVTGGFYVANTGTTPDRLFAYRAGGGELMLLQIAASGRVVYYTRKAPSVLPPVGRMQRGLNAFVSSLYTVTAPMSLSESTITTTDPATSSYTRSAIQNFTTGASRQETFIINSPREGFNRRIPGPAVHTDGSASNVAEFVGLSLRGMDSSVIGLTQSNLLGLFAVTGSNTP